jgi:hypothetical protein
VLFRATAKNMLHQIEVLAHCLGSPPATQDGEV